MTEGTVNVVEEVPQTVEIVKSGIVIETGLYPSVVVTVISTT
jgi:hypothetical protein